MAIMASKKASTYKPAPEGLHQAVCCDVWEPWSEPNPFKSGAVQDKTRIVWQIEQFDDDHGRPFEVSQIYTLSLHEKAKLRQHLEAWRGKKFTEEELRGFDLESLIGANCQIQVVHNIKESGDVYANVQALVPLGKNTTKIRVSAGFIRKKDRQQNGQEPEAETNAEVSDGEPLPF